MLQMLETGLVTKWSRMYQEKSRCFAPIDAERAQQEESQRNGPHRISMQDFAGIFVTLVIGCVLSIFTLFAEIMIRYCITMKIFVNTFVHVL